MKMVDFDEFLVIKLNFGTNLAFSRKNLSVVIVAITDIIMESNLDEIFDQNGSKWWK